MKEEELIKMLIEAKAKREFYRVKYNGSFFSNYYLAEWEYWNERVGAIKEELGR